MNDAVCDSSSPALTGEQSAHTEEIRALVRRLVWRLKHPGHPRYGGGPWTDHLRGSRCAMPSGHEGFCRSRGGFGWENRW